MQQGKRPNLFVIGAMKSGTSALHAWLGEHPSIFMSEFKEPAYFCPDHLLQDEEALALGRSEQHYMELFAKAPDQVRWIGESSTAYSKFPRSGIAEAIAEFSPDAKIIYLMRDPVERTISHYWYSVVHYNERRPALTAIRETPHLSDVSNYAWQLQPYIWRFGPSRIKTLVFEEMAANPAKAMADIFAWLDVDPGIVPADIGFKVNGGQGLVIRPAGENEDPAEAVSDLTNWISHGDEKNLAKALKGRTPGTYRVLDRERVVTPEVVDYLRSFQLHQTEYLSELLGRRFPQWTTLYGT